MNSWGNDQYMQNMMGIHGMMPNMPTAPLQPPPVPFGLIGDVNQMPAVNSAPPVTQPADFIGPIVPDDDENVVVMADAENDNSSDQVQDSGPSKERQRSDRYDRGYEKDRSRRRSRSRNRDRDHKDYHNNRKDRNRDRRDRTSKWSKEDTISQGIAMNNMMMQGQMLPGRQQMMPGQTMFPGQQMYPNQMPQYNMMTNMNNTMMNQHDMSMNMMMMNPQMQMQNMQNMMMPNMYFSAGVILPPVPGTSTSARREKPGGCRTIFIGGLPSGITEEVIMEIFQQFGSITDVKVHKQGVCHIRFDNPDSVELSFCLSGYRVKLADQSESDVVPLFVDYALNRDDQNEYERNKRRRAPTPPRIEPFTQASFTTVGEKVKSDNDFAEVAPTLAAWLERGECNKKNANTFYSLIQASNNHLRRLFNEKMTIDDEYNTLKNTFKDKFAQILMQFEQVAKILTAAKHQRVSDHFSKQQRRNIEMWLKMTEELENLKEEFNTIFDEEETEKSGQKMVSLEKYEQLRAENDSLTFELEGYKNEAHLAKDEAERKFEKFKAHFIAQQALQNNNRQMYPPLPPVNSTPKPQPPPPLPDDTTPKVSVPPSEAKLISIISAFLMVHPLGASLDYLVSYVKSMVPNVSHSAVHEALKKYTDVFQCKTTGVGACIEHKWGFAVFDIIKQE